MKLSAIKHPLFSLGLVVLAGLVVLRFVRGPEDPDMQPNKASPAPEEDRTKAFWMVYTKAAEAFRQEDYASAVKGYTEALEYRPDHETCLNNLAYALCETGDADGALAALRRYISALGSKAPRAHLQLSTWLSRREPGFSLDLDQAEKEVQIYLDHNSEDTGPFMQLGRIALLRGRLDDALEKFHVVRRFSAKCPEADHLTGVIRMARGEPEKAIPFFRRPLDQSLAPTTGVPSEGDTLATLTPNARRPELFPALWGLFCATNSLEGYSSDIPPSLRLSIPEADQTMAATVNVLKGLPVGKATPADFDGDGSDDLAIASSEGLVLLRQAGGTFEEMPRLNPAVPCQDIVRVDIEGDGDPDLLALPDPFQGGEAHLLRNDRGTLIDITESAGLSGSRRTFRALFVDVDADSDLDLIEAGGGPLPLRLWIQTAGHFEPSKQDFGLPSQAALTDTGSADFNGDGLPDLFVLVWKGASRLFQNMGKGAFKDVTADAGLDLSVAGYRAVWLDSDRDGDPDLLVAPQAPAGVSLHARFCESELSPYRLRLYVNDAGSFKEADEKFGLSQPFGVTDILVEDLNQDGWPDLYLACGGHEPGDVEPDAVFLNRQGKFVSATPPDLYRRWGRSAAVTLLSANPNRVELVLARSGMMPGSVQELLRVAFQNPKNQ